MLNTTEVLNNSWDFLWAIKISGKKNQFIFATMLHK